MTRDEAGAHVVDVPEPVPGPGEVLLRITAAGLCGTDVACAFRPQDRLTRPGTTTLGHEPAGVVAALGPEIDGWELGDRVIVNSIVSCGTCSLCTRGMSEICSRATIIGMHHDGAVAELMTAPVSNLVRLPASVPDPIGAILTDAVATPFHALFDRGGLRPGESVAIFGIGGLGQHALQLARAFGAGTVIAVDTRSEQLVHAKALGADHVFDAADPRLSDLVREANGGSGVDLAGVFVGSSPAIRAAFGTVAKGGRLVVVGLSESDVVLPPSGALARREVSLIGSGGFRMDELERLVDLVAAGRLDLSQSISHEFSLEDSASALDLLHAGSEAVRRVIVRPGGGR
ncbi:zinc-binding dehydrogenase [Nocardioides endophyticus]|uniref:Zinc-binding dehydrogenase n=1 Tax=Nocardioides endophyticus TaxID=1353775 RepID=A0ABP8YHF0_9ACTN